MALTLPFVLPAGIMIQYAVFLGWALAVGSIDHWSGRLAPVGRDTWERGTVPERRLVIPNHAVEQFHVRTQQTVYTTYTPRLTEQK